MKIKYTSLFLFGLLLLNFNAVFGTVIEKNVRFDKAQIEFSKIENYDVITMQGLELDLNPGCPQLPVKIFHFAIPNQHKIKAIRLIESHQEIFAASYNIFPAQPPQTLTAISSRKFIELKAPDENIYSSTKRYPENIVKNLGQGQFQGNNIAAIAVYFFQYIPAEKKLVFYSEIKFKIIVEADSQIRAQTVSGSGFLKLVGTNNLTEPAVASLANLSVEQYPYIIITPKNYRQSFQPLADWKTQKGIKTKIVELTTILTGYAGRDDAEKVRNFIRYAHNNWGTTWVLLGGDTDVVPYRTAFAMDCQYGATYDENKIPCDLYFADLDGDWDANGNNIFGEVDDEVDLYPEVYLGRASLNTVPEVEGWVNKVINYEKNPPLDFQKKLLFLCQLLWEVPYTDTGIGKDRIERQYLSDDFFAITKLYESNDNLSKVSAIEKINAGQNIINHTGHAWWSLMSLGDGSLQAGDMYALNNGNRTSTIYSIGCWPSAIDYDCVAEAFLANPDGGGVAFIGNSRYGWGSPGNPGYGYSDRFDDKFFYFLFKQNCNSIGEAIALAKAFYVPFARQDNVYRWCMYEINLLADPEMPLWTDIPEILNVAYPVAITTGNSGIQVTVNNKNQPVANARICLRQAENFYFVSTTNDAGQAEFEVETDNAADNIQVTVTAPNFLPFEGWINVNSNQPYVYCDRVVVDNELSNNDGILNPGESAFLSLKLKNSGMLSVDSLTLVLSADTSGLNILKGQTFLEHISNLDSVFIENIFQVEAADFCSNGDVFYPQLSIRSNSCNWNQRLALTIGTPELTLSEIKVSDANNNQNIEAGETVQIILNVKNSGLAPAQNFDVNIFSDDPYVFIQPEKFSISQFSPNEMIQDSISILLSENCPVPRFPIITLNGCFSEHDSFQTSFELAVGNLAFFDNMESGGSAWQFPETATNQWHRSKIRAYSGEYSWYCGQETDTTYVDDNLSELISEDFLLGKNAHLSFWLWYDVAIYSKSGYEGDGVHVEFFDGGGWHDLDFIGTGGALQPFLMGNDWLEYKYDLSSFAPAASVRIKFRFVSDPFWKSYPQKYEGIYFDDVRVTSSLASQIENKDIPILPDKFELSQNYPNPFNNFTVINYKISQIVNRANVVIQIYNIHGQLIKTLVDTPREAGEYSVEWNGKDNYNQMQSSGVYFYRLAVEEKFKQVKKMIFLK